MHLYTSIYIYMYKDLSMHMHSCACVCICISHHQTHVYATLMYTGVAGPRSRGHILPEHVLEMNLKFVRKVVAGTYTNLDNLARVGWLSHSGVGWRGVAPTLHAYAGRAIDCIDICSTCLLANGTHV